MRNYKIAITLAIVVALSALTFFEVANSWSALIDADNTQEAVKVDALKETIGIWEKRTPFSAETISEPVLTPIPTERIASPSAG